MDKLRLDNLRLEQANTDLKETVKEMNDALRESTKLLLKTRPARPTVRSEASG